MKFAKDPKFNKRKKRIYSAREGYYPLVEKELVDKIEEQRVQGASIGISWSILQAKELNINRETKGKIYPDAKFTSHWFEKVLARNGLSMRAVQNTRKESVHVAIPKVLAYHQSLRKLMQSKVHDLVSC